MPDAKPDSGSLLPLPPSEFRILLALLDAPVHGYGIMQEVKRRSGGQIQLGPGTLYGAVRRMLGRGLIQEADDALVPDGGDRRRKYYAITPFGRDVAKAEARRMLELLGIAGEHALLPELGRG
jgi:DNA-binding PadR family transcriptional regulator